MAEYPGSVRPGTHLESFRPSPGVDNGNNRPEDAKPVEETKRLHDDDDEEEDMDALIEELESQDGHIDDDDDDTEEPGAARVIPEELLQTDTRIGLTDAEVIARRKKYGLNQMREEKENLILKFISFFVGPIQFVMEVS
jgi:H+-transporting ATPase